MNPNELQARIVAHRSDSFTLDIELAIKAGTTAALLGPNGAGKSTTVDTLAGLLPIDEGRIELDGEVLDDPVEKIFVPAADRGIGVVFQDYLLFSHMSVAKNVAFAGTVAGRDAQKTAAEAAALLEAMGLSDMADVRPSELSGGQSQRVALARALASNPRLLLLDEPLAALDVTTRTQLRRTLRTHLDNFVGPRLLITHDPTDAFLLADLLYVVENGNIVQSGTPDAVRRRPATPYVADLVGLNLLTGQNTNGVLSLDEHERTLSSADTGTTGSVLITIRPNAIALHNEQPNGSPRNTWQTRIASLEALGDITRVTLDNPLPLSVDITPGAAAALELKPDSAVWASVKATEIHLTAAG